jgi:raffinose/stachyose/melibiose transport system substrate-binding protein
MKKALFFLLVACMACGTVFAGGTKQDGKVIIKVGDNHPDRNNGIGAVFERINADFIALHPEVEFSIESYQDQAWQEKVKIYATANQLPDVMKYWVFDYMMRPLVESGLAGKLDKNDFLSFGYLPGALEASELDGVLYGIPTSVDYWAVYVNKDLFQKAGVPIPSSWDDIIASAPRFRAINITPVVTDGREGWPLGLTYETLVQRISGDWKRGPLALRQKASFTESDFVQAAAYVQTMVKAGVFQSNISTSDYGDARNMFGQERAAMYIMGPWEMGLQTDTSFSDTFRNNLDVIKFPVIRGGKGSADDLLGWYGGNLIFNAKSKNKELAYEYLKLVGSRMAQYAWDIHAHIPAQKITPLPSDTTLVKNLLKISSDAKSTPQELPLTDLSDPAFREDYLDLCRQLWTLMVTPEEFGKKLDESAARVAAQ